MSETINILTIIPNTAQNPKHGEIHLIHLHYATSEYIGLRRQLRRSLEYCCLKLPYFNNRYLGILYMHYQRHDMATHNSVFDYQSSCVAFGRDKASSYITENSYK